jgi:4-hydroxy-3-methylbut-2-enyl diphosphate reductase
MKINLAKSAGFCFGVKRALSIAIETVGRGREVYMLGDIVHNEDVVRKIELAGIKKVRALGIGKNKTLLIRAHGAPINTIRKAIKRGYRIIDATCPMVKEIHKIAKAMEKKGYKIIVIGDKNHDEVHGIIGQLKGKALVIDNPKHIPLKMIKNIKKACVVVQSTQNLYNVLKIVDFLKLHIGQLEFFNTICQPTRMKQEEIRKMPEQNDAMIIIGSKTSANTRRLYEISKAINKRTFWIRSRKDIQPRWLKGVKRVGITAGASTPDLTTQDIMKYIKTCAI